MSIVITAKYVHLFLSIRSRNGRTMIFEYFSFCKMKALFYVHIYGKLSKEQLQSTIGLIVSVFCVVISYFMLVKDHRQWDGISYVFREFLAFITRYSIIFSNQSSSLSMAYYNSWSIEIYKNLGEYQKVLIRKVAFYMFFQHKQFSASNLRSTKQCVIKLGG